MISLLDPVVDDIERLPGDALAQARSDARSAALTVCERIGTSDGARHVLAQLGLVASEPPVRDQPASRRLWQPGDAMSIKAAAAALDVDVGWIAVLVRDGHMGISHASGGRLLVTMPDLPLPDTVGHDLVTIAAAAAHAKVTKAVIEQRIQAGRLTPIALGFVRVLSLEQVAAEFAAHPANT